MNECGLGWVGSDFPEFIRQLEQGWEQKPSFHTATSRLRQLLKEQRRAEPCFPKCVQPSSGAASKELPGKWAERISLHCLHCQRVVTRMYCCLPALHMR